MQSNNPIFNRAEGFNGRSAMGQGQMTQPGYSDPSTWQVPTYDETRDRMTIDSVVQKSAITLGTVVLVAIATWMLTPAIANTAGLVDPAAVRTLGMLSMVGSIAALVLSLVNSFKREVSPPLVLAFSVAEGVMVGAISKFTAAYSGGMDVILGAVVGTFAAAAGTLAVYKFFNITVTNRMRRYVVAAMFGFVALSLLDGVLSIFHASFGFNGFGTMGLIASVAGLLIAIFMLMLDFDFVERGVRNGMPEQESWRAAFGLTVTLVWIYINMLRIISIMRGD